MHLVHLDLDHHVLAVTPVAQASFLSPLLDPNGYYLLAVIPPAVGQVFDPAAQQFLAAPRRRWLTKLAFDQRFTMSEAINLKLSQTPPTKRDDETELDYTNRCINTAQLQVLQGRLNLASYIDLDRQDTQAGVQALEVMGLLAEGRAAAILGDPIQSHEYHPDA